MLLPFLFLTQQPAFPAFHQDTWETLVIPFSLSLVSWPRCHPLRATPLYVHQRRAGSCLRPAKATPSCCSGHEGPTMCLFRSRRTYSVLGLLCLSLRLRALLQITPRSLTPSIPSTLLPPWGPPPSLLQPRFLISNSLLLDPETPSFASFKDHPPPQTPPPP